MQKVVKIIVSILLTIGISYGIIFAWEGLTASDGDSLTHTKWNDLLSIVQTNSGELSSISSDVSSINSKLSPISNSGGNIGVGTSSPGSKFEVDGSFNIKNCFDTNAKNGSVCINYFGLWIKESATRWYATDFRGHHTKCTSIKFDGTDSYYCDNIGYSKSNSTSGLVGVMSLNISSHLPTLCGSIFSIPNSGSSASWGSYATTYGITGEIISSNASAWGYVEMPENGRPTSYSSVLGKINDLKCTFGNHPSK